MKEKIYNLSFEMSDGVAQSVRLAIPCGENGKDGADGKDGTMVENSSINGNIIINGAEAVVYDHPETHESDEIIVSDGYYGGSTATEAIYGVKHEIDSFASFASPRISAAYRHTETPHAPSNAQANVIETIKVNGVAQPISNKAVNITVSSSEGGSANVEESEVNGNIKVDGEEIVVYDHPETHESDEIIVSDGRYRGNTATQTFNELYIFLNTVDSSVGTHTATPHAPSNAQANVIEAIKVNGVAQAVSGKAVDIPVPTVEEIVDEVANAVIGDIDIALDSIIALQNSLINGEVS